MRHTKSWHNLIRDLFNYKITAIEHFSFFFVRLVLVFVRVACLYAFVLFSIVNFRKIFSLYAAAAIGSPFALLILFLCSLFHWAHSWILTILICIVGRRFHSKTIISNYQFVTAPIQENFQKFMIFTNEKKSVINFFMAINSNKKNWNAIKNQVTDDIT